MEVDPAATPSATPAALVEAALLARLQGQRAEADVRRRVANPMGAAWDQSARKEAGAVTQAATMRMAAQLRSQRSEHDERAHLRRMEQPETARLLRQQAHVRRLKELMAGGRSELDAEAIIAAEEEHLAHDEVVEQATPSKVVDDVKALPDYWMTVGREVAGKLPMPLTCDLAAGFAVYALREAASFHGRVEVVQLISKSMDNHFIVVVGRDPSTPISADPGGWGADAFVIDVWGFLQDKCPLVAKPPSILADMSDPVAYPRSVMVAIQL